MPLSDHEQRILEEIEKRLQEDDPRFAHQVARSSLYAHLARRVRWGALGFVAGLVMLLLFARSVWIAVLGFVVMLGAALFVYYQVRRIGRDHPAPGRARGRISPPGFLGRIAQRFRREPEKGQEAGND